MLLFGGFAILFGLMLLGYLFVNANPARLARIVKWTGIVLAALAVLALAFYGRLAVFLAPVALAVSLLRRFRGGLSGVGGPSSGQSSDVETAFIRMRLDHDAGTMNGTVLQGRYVGRQIEELGLSDMLALLRECRAADEDGARLVEAYLDRAHPDWRDAWRGGEAPPRAVASDVSVEEAYAILGLSPGADEAAIRAAHHRLMKQLHPDHGGTDYLATKINRARDVLLPR